MEHSDELTDEERQPCEIWRVHPELKSYEASSLGRVRRCGGSIRQIKQVGVGYVGVNIVHSGKHRVFYVHRLVLDAFRGPCPKGCEASHLNGNRQDNRIDNLEWESRAKNASRRRAHGTSGAGEKNTQAKLKRWQVDFIRRTKADAIGLAAWYGVSAGTIRDIRAGRTWRMATC